MIEAFLQQAAGFALAFAGSTNRPRIEREPFKSLTKPAARYRDVP